MPETQAFMAVVQDEDGGEETELVTIEWRAGLPVIETTGGVRITCLEPAGEQAREREAA